MGLAEWTIQPPIKMLQSQRTPHCRFSVRKQVNLSVWTTTRTRQFYIERLVLSADIIKEPFPSMFTRAEGALFLFIKLSCNVSPRKGQPRDEHEQQAINNQNRDGEPEPHSPVRPATECNRSGRCGERVSTSPMQTARIKDKAENILGEQHQQR